MIKDEIQQNIKEQLVTKINEYSSLTQNINYIEKVENLTIDKNFKEDLLNYKNRIQNLEIRNSNILYIIKFSEEKNTDKIIAKFSNFKAQKEYATCRINKNKSNYLYVGSCQKNFKTRIQQHLGIIQHNKTSALHLSKWWEENFGDLEYTIIQVDAKYQSYLQLFEDLLWEKYLPILGKEGKK